MLNFCIISEGYTSNNKNSLILDYLTRSDKPDAKHLKATVKMKSDHSYDLTI